MTNIAIKNRPRQRTAFTLLEMVLACAMFVLCGVIVAEMLHLFARQERAVDARQAALRAVANRLEQLQARTWEELPVSPLADEPPPTDVTSLLKGATMQTEVVDAENGAAREIRVQVVWSDPAGNRAQPIALSAWKHRPAARSAEEQP